MCFEGDVEVGDKFIEEVKNKSNEHLMLRKISQKEIYEQHFVHCFTLKISSYLFFCNKC
jgi:hypothetical protein